MSSALQARQICQNRDCNTRGDIQSFIEKRFCSNTCKWETKGRKALKDFKYNHKFCFTCGSRLKHVEEPTDEQLRSISGFYSKESVIGFQYPTPNAAQGQKDADGKVVSGLICGVCGNCNHQNHFSSFANVQLLLDRWESRDDDNEINQEQVFEKLVDGYDLFTAVGCALTQ